MEVKKYINDLYQKGSVAYAAIDDFSQEQIDAMLEKMALKTLEHAEELGKMVHEESKLGDLETKIQMMQLFPLIFWKHLKEKNGFGLIDSDKERKIDTYGKAMGVVACLTPSTTNILNAFEISMKAIKSGNAIVHAPHPRCWNSMKRLVEILSDAIVEAGGPANLVQSMEDPTIEMSGLLMKTCDVVVGTGGAGMVKAAYSSGKPAFGVGQGNVPHLIGEKYDDIEKAVTTMIGDRTIDNGMPCTSAQCVLIPRSRKDEVLESFRSKGAYIVDDKETVDRIRPLIFDENGKVELPLVGIPAVKLAEPYGLELPEGTRLIMLKLEDGVRGDEDILNKEIMNPTIRYQFYDDFNDAVEIAKANLLYEGAGHSATIWTNDPSEIERYAKKVPVVRCLVNQGGTGTANFFAQNGMSPSTTVGCGTWGGNNFSDNLDFTTLQNHTKVIYPISEGAVPTFEEVFGK